MSRFDTATAARCIVKTMFCAATVAVLFAGVARSDEQTAMLTLDGQATVAYSETANASLPSGSTIRFRFGSAGSDGTIPITILPEDVSIAPITVGEGATIQYSLGKTATGTLRNVSGSKHIDLFATLVATLNNGAESAPIAYQLHFTTGAAAATNAAQTESVSVSGRPVASSNHVKLVGAATNDPEAFPGPGEAVYAVLSGTFDSLPSLP